MRDIRRRRRRQAVAALALAYGMLGGAGSAAASWETAKPVDSAGTGYGASYLENALAVGSNGVATALFFQQAPNTPPGSTSGSPFAIRRGAGAGAGWSAPAAIPTSGTINGFITPGLAAGADGGTLGVFAVGGGSNTVGSAWPAGDAAPGAATTILCTSAAPFECAARTPQVAMDGSGNGYAVAATEFPGGASSDVLFSRTDPATGSWGTAQVVAQGSYPRLAVDPGGDVVITYMRPDPNAPSASRGRFERLYAKRAPAGAASFGAEQLISGPSNTTDNVPEELTALVIDGSGNAMAAFPQGTQPPITSAPVAPAIFAVRWPHSSATPDTEVRLSTPDEGQGRTPALAVDPQGRVTAAWEGAVLNSAVYWAQYVPASGWSSGERLSPQFSPDSYKGPKVAADADGTATVAYLDQPNSNPSAGYAVVAQRKRAGQEPWSAPVTISATGAGTGGVNSLQVAAGKAGQADATFLQQLDGTNRLFATRFTDTTAPTITITTPMDGATYDQGATVIADYSCTDEPGGSGLASCSGPVPSGQPIDTSTAGDHTFAVTATDKAGNSASKTVAYTVKAGPPPPETTPPTVTITSPSDGATYQQGKTVNARYSCQDEPGGSGLKSCRGTVPSGEPIDTRTPGTKTFAVTASDNAGNTASKTVTYTVEARAGGGGKPNTRIVAARINSRRHLAKFRFRASGGTAPYRFECTLLRPKRLHQAKQRSHPCTSPKLYRRLRAGRYAFEVRAVDSTGVADPSPAKRRFRIHRHHHR
jgi:hypothetical protein